ncbi:hypothetical protein LXL04_006889 [Taraxacum kok-saghyz]
MDVLGERKHKNISNDIPILGNHGHVTPLWHVSARPVKGQHSMYSQLGVSKNRTGNRNRTNNRKNRNRKNRNRDNNRKNRNRKNRTETVTITAKTATAKTEPQPKPKPKPHRKTETAPQNFPNTIIVERLEFSSSAGTVDSPELAVSVRKDISQIQTLCSDMDGLWRSVASKLQRDLWKSFLKHGHINENKVRQILGRVEFFHNFHLL